MANIKVSQMTSADTLTGVELIPIVQGGANKKLTIGNLFKSAAWITLPAGTTTANTAPLKFTSGPLNTTAEVGAVEFLADAYYGTITTGAVRRQFAFTNDLPISGSFSGTGTATTTFTVTIGQTMVNTTYKVNMTPTSILGAAIFYINNKTTTTFDVVYLTGLTGTLTFDWSVFK